MQNQLFETIDASDLVKAIHPDAASAKGFHFFQYDLGKRLVRTKVFPDQLDLVLSQVPASKRLHVSTSTYSGQGILLNVVATRVLAVELDHLRGAPIRSAEHLSELLMWRLSEENIPSHSAIAFTPQRSTILWVLDEAIEYPEFFDAYTAEFGLIQALQSLGAMATPRGMSRTLALPTNSAIACQQVSLVCPGTIRTVTKHRLLRSVYGRIGADIAEANTRNCELIEEINSLFFFRFFVISNQVQLAVSIP